MADSTIQTKEFVTYQSPLESFEIANERFLGILQPGLIRGFSTWQPIDGTHFKIWGHNSGPRPGIQKTTKAGALSNYRTSVVYTKQGTILHFENNSTDQFGPIQIVPGVASSASKMYYAVAIKHQYNPNSAGISPITVEVSSPQSSESAADSDIMGTYPELKVIIGHLIFDPEGVSTSTDLQDSQTKYSWVPKYSGNIGGEDNPTVEGVEDLLDNDDTIVRTNKAQTITALKTFSNSPRILGAMDSFIGRPVNGFEALGWSSIFLSTNMSPLGANQGLEIVDYKVSEGDFKAAVNISIYPNNPETSEYNWDVYSPYFIRGEVFFKSANNTAIFKISKADEHYFIDNNKKSISLYYKISNGYLRIYCKPANIMSIGSNYTLMSTVTPFKLSGFANSGYYLSPDGISDATELDTISEDTYISNKNNSWRDCWALISGSTNLLATLWGGGTYDWSSAASEVIQSLILDDPEFYSAEQDPSNPNNNQKITLTPTTPSEFNDIEYRLELRLIDFTRVGSNTLHKVTAPCSMHFTGDTLDYVQVDISTDQYQPSASGYWINKFHFQFRYTPVILTHLHI